MAFYNELDSRLRIVRKTADEIVNNSTAMQDDNELKLNVGANEALAVDLYIYVVSPSVNPDMDIGWTIPAGAWGNAILLFQSGGNNSGNITNSQRINVYTTNTMAVQHIIFVCGATPGTLQLQWAQGTATVEDTKVMANSFIVAHRIF